MSIITIVGVVHVCLMLVMSFFYVFAKSKFDFLMLAYQYAVFLSWSLLEGQCALSYFVKQGDSSKVEDVYALFDPSLRAQVNIGLYVITVLQSICFLVILSRNHLSLFMALPPVIFYGLNHFNVRDLDFMFSFIFLTALVYSLFRFFKWYRLQF